MIGCIKWTLCFMLDVLCIFVAYMPSLILHADPDKYLYLRGVNCKDRNFQYPKTRVPSIDDGMWAGINLIPAMVFALGEIFTNCSHFNQSFYKVATTFLFGALTSNSLTYLAKFYVGHLRPNFLDVCNIDCTDKGWVLDPMCVSETDEDRIDARLSFYSYYSSHVMYCMAFTAFYIQARMKDSRLTQLVKPTIQLLLMLLAMWVGFTRINDNKNHLYDVLIGLLQGAFLAYLIVYYLFPEVFKLPEEVEERDEQQALQVPELEQGN